jgi:hypothetical protein
MITTENDLKKFILKIWIGFIWLRTGSTKQALVEKAMNPQVPQKKLEYLSKYSF